MKKIIALSIFISLCIIGFAQQEQQPMGCEQYSVFDRKSNPDLGIVISSNDAEATWNALRLATYAQSKGDKVVIFLLGKGLEGYQTKDSTFALEPLKDEFMGNGGQTIACGTCAQKRGTDEIGMCTIASLADLYYIINRSKKVISF